MAERIASILKDFEELQLEIDEEERLDIMEEEEDDWNPEKEHDDVNGQMAEEGTITFSGGAQVLEQRAWAAAEYHWSTTSKHSRSRESTSRCYRFLRNEREWTKLGTFYEQGLVKRNGRHRLLEIANVLKVKIIKKINEGVPLHDRDINMFALAINRRSPDPVANFAASDSWLKRFKRHVRLTSRRLTRFYQKKALLYEDRLKDAAQKFVTLICHEMGLRSPDSFINIYQSGFTKKMRVPRCLSFKGEKNTVRVVQSTSAVTHSLTVMPLIFASGKLVDGEMLFVQLPEQNGRFPQSGILDAKNLHVVPGYSHIMTKQTTLSFFEHVFVPQMPKNCAVILDSWKGVSNQEAIQVLYRQGKSFIFGRYHRELLV